MDKFTQLIVLSEQESPIGLTSLARSAGISVTQQRMFDITYGGIMPPDTLLACPYYSLQWQTHAIAAELVHLQQKSALFLFQAERRLLAPITALQVGIRGVIYRDEQSDRVLTALKTMMAGELYYARTVMSDMVDQLLQEKWANQQKQLKLADHNLLTRQEKRIIELVATGARNTEIAADLQISVHTVKAHMSAIFRKTQARNRVELLRWVQQTAQQQ